MTLKQYLILVGCGSLIAWVSWLMVLFTVNPFEAGALGFLFFYISLAIALIGTLAILGFGVRMFIHRHEGIVLREVATAFRQACLFTVVLVGSLLLQSRSLLAWWNALLFIGAVTTIELFFLSSRISR